MDEMPQVIGRRMKLLGIENADQLAHRVGVAKRQIERYLAGDAKPQGATLLKLAGALEISPSTLMGEGIPAVDVSGRWVSAWQTWMDDVERAEIEYMDIRQEGTFLRIEGHADPDHVVTGSYAWIGEARLIHDTCIAGYYYSTDPGVRSNGTIFLTLNAPGTIGIGQWSGFSHDGICETGRGALARDRMLAEAFLRAIKDTTGTITDFPRLG